MGKVAALMIAAVAVAAINSVGGGDLFTLSNAFRDKDKYRFRTDNYLFYEGNDCKQQIAGSFWKSPPRESVNAKKSGTFFDNDEARSVMIQGPISAGQVLWVCDHPDHCERDDRTRIYVKKAINAYQGYCVGTFERSYEDSVVKVQFYRKNGLDGKVSHVRNYD